MRMHDIGKVARHEPLSQQRGDACQGREAERVVRPIPAIGPTIGIAVTRKKVRCVQHEQFEARRLRRHHVRFAAEQVVQAGDNDTALQGFDY